MGIWTDELDKTWLEELVHQAVVLGNKSNSGFKKEAWTALKSRYDTIKGMYGVVVKLANSSGWDGVIKVPCQMLVNNVG
ncbi:hypothetical protein H257_01850 [Aphanomyces astaci]|uniref:Myb/SANT-like domain-containing protein n=1 Tax=Aphanomyces astaci TaxID=112090 RepID=W4H4E8_APHAT|nr:hypothetical protein H257_01850 [Aphanomyces astaci]ETV86767.1 hypothetical protein H257_01850 [Aphanomyces astaci]|eukprot:XP_009823566.1 hypothetical protein H257_01850 [Aphanomyces astaci]